MKAKYAAAIRAGLAQARLANYGSERDRYYELRSKLIYGEVFPADGDRHRASLALEAFNRATRREIKRRREAMTPTERRAADKLFIRSHTLHVESRSEREMRQLREEVEAMRNELKIVREDGKR